MCIHETLPQEKEKKAKTRITPKPMYTQSKVFLLNSILWTASHTTNFLRKYFALVCLPGEALKLFQIITTSGGNQAPRLFPTVNGQSRAQLEWLVLTQPKAAARTSNVSLDLVFSSHHYMVFHLVLLSLSKQQRNDKQ